MLDSRIVGEFVKPNRTEKKKEKNYHIAFGRWCIQQSNNQKHIDMLINIDRNKKFIVANKQWELPEDKINFLLDESGQTNSRIRTEFNFIQIMHNQFIGNVLRMGLNVKVSSFSPMVKVRKEQSLNEAMLWYTAAQNATPEVAQTIKANKPIGNSEIETVEQHDLFYSDKYVRDMNSLVNYSKNVNNIKQLMQEVGESISYSGIGIIRPEPMNGEFVGRVVQPERFFWDREARKYDLSDAGYMGEFEEMIPTDIYELKQNLDREEIEKIERYSGGLESRTSKNDRVRVYKAIWRDLDISEWGYVENEFGDIVFEKINYTYEDEEKPRYTDSDLLPLSKLTKYQKDILSSKRQVKDKAKTMIYADVWRYCEFIPSEYITDEKAKEGTYSDLVLSYGELPYQEKNLYSPFNMETPYKVGIYMYVDGYVYSPIDIAINPQRISNRIMSVVENMMNNARGSGNILAKEAINNSDYDEAEFDRKMKNNETIVVSAGAFGGVQNAVGKYDGSFSMGMQHQMEVAQMFLQTIEKITGVNEAMKGQMESPDQLVGTMQLMIQKGTVVTERYYAAIQGIVMQFFDSLCSVGKRYYINERPKLVSIVGDEGAEVIELSKDMKNEDFRCSIKFTMDDLAERQYVDGTIIQFLQAGLIDRESFANIIGRGNSDDMYLAMRRYAKETAEAEKMASQQQQMQQQQMMGQQQQNVDNALGVQEKKINADLLKEAMKGEVAQQQVNKQVRGN